MKEVKNWSIEYDHGEGKGITDAVTEVIDNDDRTYGTITVEGHTRQYDLRYTKGNLHRAMIGDFFRSGLIKATAV